MQRTIVLKPTVAVFVVLACGALGSWRGVTSAPASAMVSVETLERQARDRLRVQSRVALRAPAVALDDAARLHGLDTPSYLKVFGSSPQLVVPFARAVEAFLFRGALPTELKAAMGLRIAQVNGSPYVAAHMQRLLRAGPHGREILRAAGTNTLATLSPDERLALTYAESLTRSVASMSDDEFASVRSRFNDAELVELTMTVCFFNYFTRYAEALRLPVEGWALDSPAPAPAAKVKSSKARVALVSDAEIAATAAAAEAAKNAATQRAGLGLGMANSQRAMVRAPEVAIPWRAFGAAVRELETVGRDIKLQVSFAVSMANGCRYCTLHQVLGLRRLGVDPAKLVAMRKDDSVLTQKELAAVQFARKLTETPAAITDADYGALRTQFGEQGALEIVLQTCNFAFMNRFTDGLRLPSEDEAVRVYREVYGTAFTPLR